MLRRFGQKVREDVILITAVGCCVMDQLLPASISKGMDRLGNQLVPGPLKRGFLGLDSQVRAAKLELMW